MLWVHSFSPDGPGSQAPPIASVLGPGSSVPGPNFRPSGVGCWVRSVPGPKSQFPQIFSFHGSRVSGPYFRIGLAMARGIYKVSLTQNSSETLCKQQLQKICKPLRFSINLIKHK